MAGAIAVWFVFEVLAVSIFWNLKGDLPWDF
jgi:hypothetical protein